MALIPMYLLPPDIELLNDWLNQENEIAFLVADDPGKWIAQNTRAISRDIGTQVAMRGHSFLRPGYVEYNLWHVPSGPLPLLTQGLTDGLIQDPWHG